MSNSNTDNIIETPIDHNFHQLESRNTLKWEATLPFEYWEYRRKWREYPKDHFVDTFPIHLDIEATNACNLSCIMCPRTDNVKTNTFWKTQHFDFERYKQLIDEGIKEGLCSIKFNYLGEPLLNPKLIDMITYAKLAGVIDVMFNTNATLLTEKMSRRLVASGLDKLFFSFDSPFREKYNEIRKGADYDSVLANIRQFMTIRRALGSVKPFTRVSMVTMKDNQNENQAFQELFEPIVDAVAFVDYLDHSNQNNPERMIIPLETRKKKFCCPQLWQRMFVHPDGVVTVCCIDSDRNLTVGNVFEQTVKEIWLGKPYKNLRKLHKNGHHEQIQTCRDCPLTKY